MKFAAKELERSAKKCEKDNVNDKLKLKRVSPFWFHFESSLIFFFNLLFNKAIEQGNMEGAKIYAENAIRNKNQALNFR